MGLIDLIPGSSTFWWSFATFFAGILAVCLFLQRIEKVLREIHDRLGQVESGDRKLFIDTSQM